MSKKVTKKPTWSDLKHKLADLDRNALIGLVQDLYRADKDNQTFLHTRFGLGDDILKPYKATISRWVCPDVMSNQGISTSKAKKAITDYKKAVDYPDGIAELSVFYCECCAEFLGYCCVDYEAYFDALVHMFDQALKAISQLQPDQQAPMIDRLEQVQCKGYNWGYGAGDDMGDLLAEYAFAEEGL